MSGIVRALTMLNESGDTTLVWTPDRDDDMEQIIERKMAEGCVFYVIEPRFGTREKLTDARDANRHRMLAIRDEDFARFVGASAAEETDPRPSEQTPTAAVVATPDKPVKGARRAKSAKEVAQGESIGVRPRRGG